MTQLTWKAYWYPVMAIPTLLITTLIAFIITRLLHSKEKREARDIKTLSIAPATLVSKHASWTQVKQFIRSRSPSIRGRRKERDLEKDSSLNSKTDIPLITTRAPTMDVNMTPARSMSTKEATVGSRTGMEGMNSSLQRSRSETGLMADRRSGYASSASVKVP